MRSERCASYLLESRREAENPSLADELERLAQLRRDGALTDTEFTLAKGRVL